MADEEENMSKEISEFLYKSCQQSVPRWLKLPEFFRGISYPAKHPIDCVNCKVFPVVTGSQAEFYIHPVLSCVGDIDIMYHYSNELAIPVGHPPPVKLPTYFDRCVKIFEIVDSHIPGYVHLDLSCRISRSKNCGKYVITENVDSWSSVLSHDLYITAGVSDSANIHGPASTGCMTFLTFGTVEWDTVPCVRCLVWPTQAYDWPTRHRNYDWPDSATVDRVVSNGCDLVGVAHSLCREDEWMNKHQWRLSFSRAEVVLLNSWIPTQQIAYHMLRMFVKSERLTDSANSSDKCALSNYHIKTLMLWACEVKPLTCWTDGSNLVSLCVHLLQFLNEWLTKMNGQHYFINNVHFLDYFDTFSIDTIAAVVSSITQDSLCRWFVDNYMRKCAESCPHNISLLSSDVVTGIMLHEAASTILKWREHISSNVSMKDIFSDMLAIDVPCYRSWSVRPLDLVFAYIKRRLLPHLRGEGITEVNIRNFCSNFLCQLIDLIGDREHPFQKLFLDQTAFMMNIYEHCLDDEKCPVQFVSSNKCDSLSAVREAAVWLKIVANRYPNNYQPAHTELAKVYLVRALRCVDSDSDSIYDLANVYLAVLCYITGQYQKATDHCTLVTRSLSYPQCSSHVVDGELLPKIDDDIDNVLGLVAFYQYVRTTTLKQRQQVQQASVFTTELFAHYFNIRHLLVAKCRLAPKAQEKHVLPAMESNLCEEVTRFRHVIVSTPRLFVSDLMLCKFANNSSLREISSSATTSSGVYSKQQLVELLTQLSIERMLACRQLMLPKDTEFTDVETNDLVELRLYRCQLYERCMQLCQRSVREIIDGRVRQTSRLSFVYHEFVQLMDGDILSLVGMAVLVNKSAAQSWFKEPISINKLTMLLYLLTQSQIKILSSKWKPDISLLADVLDLIGEAQTLIPSHDALDQLIVKLAERLAVVYITEQLNFPHKQCTHR